MTSGGRILRTASEPPGPRAGQTAPNVESQGRPCGPCTGSGTTAYDYDDADQLTSVTPPGQQAIEYSWDDNGNLLQRGADTYDWDAGDKLTSATVGAVTTDMAYNGDGLRDSRTVDEDTVTFTWDISQSVPQVIDDGPLAYVYGLGRISQVDDDDTTYYYLSDDLGSTMALTDADGEVANTYEYDVFGAVRASTGSQPNEFRFTGEQVDESTSLQYLRARYYDPATGRFLSQDPIPYIQRYAYVKNNPCNSIDPSGQCRVDVKLVEYTQTKKVQIGLTDQCIFGVGCFRLPVITITRTIHTGLYHAVVVTADPITGEKMGFRGDRSGSGFGRVVVSHRAWDEKHPDYHTGLPSKTAYPDDGGSCGGINARLGNVEAQINAAGKPYRPFAFIWGEGWNSNSAARELLESGGLPVGKPEGYSVPLWDKDLLP